jgi:hypothetical protein
MGDRVEVVIDGDGEPYIRKHRISSGTQTITVTMSLPPTPSALPGSHRSFAKAESRRSPASTHVSPLNDWQTGDSIGTVED